MQIVLRELSRRSRAAALLAAICLIIGPASLLADSEHSDQEHHQIEIEVAEILDLDFGPLRRVAVAHPNILDVDVKSGRIQFFGMKPGATTVLIWTLDGVRITLSVNVIAARSG